MGLRDSLFSRVSAQRSHCPVLTILSDDHSSHVAKFRVSPIESVTLCGPGFWGLPHNQALAVTPRYNPKLSSAGTTSTSLLESWSDLEIPPLPLFSESGLSANRDLGYSVYLKFPPNSGWDNVLTWPTYWAKKKKSRFPYFSPKLECYHPSLFLWPNSLPFHCFIIPCDC